MPAKKVSLDNAPIKKPSLASLKPDKAVGVAARKRAVKKIEAGMTTKVATTKVSKKAGEQKVVIKRAGKKEKKVLANTQTPDSVLMLPTNISIRAREKALVLLEAISCDFEKSAKQVAYVSGLCFILLGASMSLAFTTPFSNTQGALLFDSTTTTTPGTVPITTVTTVANPTFNLLDQLPVEVTGKTTHRIDVTNAQYVDVKLYSLNTNSQIGLQVEDDATKSRFTFTLDPERLDAGQYVAKLIVKSNINQSMHTFTLGSFAVPHVPGDGGEIVTDEDGDTEDVEGTEETDDTPAAEVTEEVEEEQPETVVVPSLRLRVPQKELSGYFALKVEASAPVSQVKVSVRALRSITPILNSSAELRNGAWYYFFNTLNIPNGEYEIIAQSRVGDASIQSNAVKVKIVNFVTPRAATTPASTQTTTTPAAPQAPAGVTPTAPRTPPATPTAPSATVQVTTPQDSNTAPNEPTSAQTTPLRTFSEFSINEVSDFASSTVVIESEIEQDVQAVFTENKDELRDLLKRYAIAQQSGDPIMLEMAKQALTGAKQKLVNGVLNNPNANHLADNIDEELNGRFEKLQKRIDTFEELRRTASNNESSSDKDGDGVSDYDESFLFGTDPEAADSDNDGVLDGIEIMGGYNPVDPSAEAIIEYELPQESFALIEEELLKVDAVAPVIRNDLDEQNPEVQAEIRGKGLPNSFVTIYIFSTPTIVTVRTDQDGSFVYNFEKELEDGEHEVYVAVTDNTGAIVAHSNPFKFVKEAQAFTPVDGDEAASTEIAAYDVKSLDVYNVIIGLGILALGLILLMLGIGLREREKVVMINPVPSNDLSTT